MRLLRAWVVAIALVGSVAGAAELELKELEGDWRVFGLKSKVEGGSIRIRGDIVTALRQVADGPLFLGAGASRLELSPDWHLSILTLSPQFDHAETVFGFRVEAITGGWRLRNGETGWTLARLAPAEVEKLAQGAAPPITTTIPRKRSTTIKPKLVMPAILAEKNRVPGPSDLGAVAVDARWSNHGHYLKGVIDGIQLQWERSPAVGKNYPDVDTSVTVKFVMNAKGLIARIVSVDSSAGEVGAEACVSAIRSQAPFGEWPDDMKKLLGEEQEMTFTFYYK